MIEKIHSENYQLNLNQRDQADPGEHQANIQNNIVHDPLDNNPFFNLLFSELSSEDPQQKEEKAEDKKQDTKINLILKSELYKEEQQNIFPEKDLNINNPQFQNDIEEVIEDNVDNELYYSKFENLTSIIHINPNITLNDDINININKNFSQHKNSNINRTKNKNEPLNEKLIVRMGSLGNITTEKGIREKYKVKYKKKCIKTIAKKCYIKYFIRFLKKYGNNLIKKSKVQKKFNNNKLFSPTKSLISFLINENNTNILLFTVKDIFCYKNKNLKNNSQIKNEKYINNVLDYINEFYDEDKENYANIISFFNMNIQDACELFEESKRFECYKTNQNIIIHNEAFKQKYGFCLIEKNGFIKLIKKDGNSADKNK